MNRRIHCAIAVLSLLFALSILAAPPGLADFPAIEARGALRVLMILGLDGRSTSSLRADSAGFDYELLDGFAHMRRLRLEVMPVQSWDQLIPELLADRGDVIAGSFTVTDARRKLIDFSTEVMPTRSIVVTRRPHRVINTEAELRAEKVTVFKGSSTAELLLGLGVPPANLSYDVPAVGLTIGLKSGQVACVVHDVQTAFTDRIGDPDLQLGLLVGPARSYAFGVRKADVQLRAALDDYVANIKRSGSWNRRIVKYFGDGALPILQKIRGE